MQKQEFLAQLKKRLAGLPKKDLEDRLAFYEESIEDRKAEGKSEEEAVAEIGTVDEVVQQIAADTPLVKLVKEKTKPKRALRAWEIVLLILGFPLWFPLLLVGLVLFLVAYLLVWIGVIVTYAIEAALLTTSVGGIITFFMTFIEGQPNIAALGYSLAGAGGALLFVFACVWATRGTLKLSKRILIGIKTSFIGKGE